MIPHFHVIFGGQYISEIILIIQGHLQLFSRSKGQFQGKVRENIIFNK